MLAPDMVSKQLSSAVCGLFFSAWHKDYVMTVPDLFLGLVNTPILVQPLPSS